MHDTNLEERLRSVLRQDGESIPFTITTDELERRLALRRRARNGQRLGLMAAGLAVLAVGAVFALGSGWLRGTNVAADPSSSPSASDPRSTEAPSAAPSATPAPSQTPRVADPVGAAGEAVFVTPIGNSQRPDRFEVTAYDTATSTSRIIATIPGSVLPEDGYFDSSHAQISATGWLAIDFQLTTEGDGEFRPAIAIFDTRAPDAEPWILDGYGGMSWDVTDKLVVVKGEQVFVTWPMSRFLQPFSVQGRATVSNNGIAFGNGPAVALQGGARFLATSLDEPQAWGYVDFDGVFTPTNDLPPVYARTGLERPAGADAHGLGGACDSGPDDASSGCWLIESDASHEPVETWIDYDAEPDGAEDYAWAADGASVWFLVRVDANTVSLTYATAPDARTERARIDGAGDGPRLLGITGETTAGSATTVVIGDQPGFVRGVVGANGSVDEFDGTAWFAGWAADPAPYDPD